jgi:glycosyltransferase involved in cell wall biosynthesis
MVGTTLLGRLRRRARGHEVDVAFYVPNVGKLLSTDGLGAAGGAETQAVALAKALAAHGLRVAMIAYGRPDTLPATVAGMKIVVRPPYRKRGVIIGKGTEILHIWGSLLRAPAHTIVTRCAGVQVGLIALFSRLSGRRLVYAVAATAEFERDGLEKLLPRRHDRALYRLGVRLADAVVVQTEEQAELFRVAMGRDASLIKSIAEPAEEGDDQKGAFLWVGRFAEYKRPMEYVELARAIPDARFWMVALPGSGAGDELELAVRSAAEGVPNLALLPPRPHTALCELIDRAVACVNTSDFEGMPNVLLEGWARGVPALALAHDPGGVIERHGLGTFAEGSFPHLVAATRDLWEQRGTRCELAARCRAYVAAHHSSEAIVDGWLGVLRCR